MSKGGADYLFVVQMKRFIDFYDLSILEIKSKVMNYKSFFFFSDKKTLKHEGCSLSLCFLSVPGVPTLAHSLSFILTHSHFFSLPSLFPRKQTLPSLYSPQPVKVTMKTARSLGPTWCNLGLISPHRSTDVSFDVFVVYVE